MIIHNIEFLILFKITLKLSDSVYILILSKVSYVFKMLKEGNMSDHMRRFVLGLCLISSLNISNARAAGDDDYFYDCCVSRNVTASVCVRAVECLDAAQKASPSASSSIWDNKLLLIGASAVAGAVLTKTIPWIYNGISRYCGRLGEREDFDRTVAIETYIPDRIRNVGTLRTRLIEMDGLLRGDIAHPFQRNALAYEKRGWLKRSVCFLGYRYQNNLGEKVDITFNPNHRGDTFYHMPVGTTPIEPSIITIVDDYNNSVPRWSDSLRDWIFPEHPRYETSLLDNMHGIDRNFLGDNSVFQRIRDRFSPLTAEEPECHIYRELIPYDYISNRYKNVITFAVQGNLREVPSVMLTFY